LPGRDHDAGVGQRDQVALAEPAGIVAYLEAIGTGDDQVAAARRLHDRDSRVEPGKGRFRDAVPAGTRALATRRVSE